MRGTGWLWAAGAMTAVAGAMLGGPASGGNTQSATNWPQWRGPLGTGMAPGGAPPLRWDARANVRWRTAIPGRGSSTPVVWGDRVFVAAAVDTGRPAPRKPAGAFEKRTEAPGTLHQFIVLCLDRATGKERWRKVAREAGPHEGHHPTHSYAAASPVTDGRRLIVSFGSQGVFAYDLDGRLLWERDLGDMDTRLGWGEGASPALHGDTVVVNWDHEGPDFIVALDATTGKERWRVPRDEPTSWATPLVVPHAGTVQVIVSATNRVRSYELASGKVLWECAGQTANVIPTPVSAGGVVYCMSGYRGQSAMALPLSARGDISGTQRILWHVTRGTPYVPSPLLAGGRLYFTQANDALLTILNAADGRVLVDRERLPDLRSVYSSPAGAGDRLYLTDREGTTLVLRLSDRVEVLATNRLGEPVDASPAISGKDLFLRASGAVFCLSEG